MRSHRRSGPDPHVYFDSAIPAQRKKLASFVLEHCGEIRALVAGACRQLASLTNGDESFSGYLLGP
jgi:hypothetical protein